MIKIIFYLFLFCFSFLSYGQEAKISNQQIKSDSIYTVVDEMAEFPGGLQAFRSEVQRNFNPSNFIGKGRLKSETTFVVDKTGKIVNIKSTGSKLLGEEMNRVLSKMKIIWKPAKVNGEPVNYLFRLPMTMNFE